MGAIPIRRPLRRAIEELQAAREELAGSENTAQLDGILTQLHYYVDGDTRDPEAQALPPPGALETIEERVDSAIDGADGEAAEHLRTAREHIHDTLVAMDERLHDGRSSSPNR